MLKLDGVGTPPRGRGILILAVLPVLLLGGCGSYVTGSEKIADVDPALWSASRSTLPVELHGTLPGEAGRTLAGLFSPPRGPRYASAGPVALPSPGHRIVLYVNAATLPPSPLLCSQPDMFQADAQPGERAHVTAALCDGREVITRATGLVSSRSKSARDLEMDFGLVEDALFDALQPPEYDPQGFAG